MATLKNLVDETTNIKNEIVECHSNLSSILTSKNVEVSEEDKMSDLINKTNDLYNVYVTSGSDGITMETIYMTNTGMELSAGATINFGGDYKICARLRGKECYFYIHIYRNGQLLYNQNGASWLRTDDINYVDTIMDVPMRLEQGDVVCLRGRASYAKYPLNGYLISQGKLNVNK